MIDALRWKRGIRGVVRHLAQQDANYGGVFSARVPPADTKFQVKFLNLLNDDGSTQLAYFLLWIHTSDEKRQWAETIYSFLLLFMTVERENIQPGPYN